MKCSLTKVSFRVPPMELRDTISNSNKKEGMKFRSQTRFVVLKHHLSPQKSCFGSVFLFQRRKPIELLRIWRLKYEGLRFVEINEALFEIVIKVQSIVKRDAFQKTNKSFPQARDQKQGCLRNRSEKPSFTKIAKAEKKDD